jgi:hypothetical protein
MFALEQDIIHAGAPVLTQAALQADPIRYHGVAGANGGKTADQKGPWPCRRQPGVVEWRDMPGGPQ